MYSEKSKARILKFSGSIKFISLFLDGCIHALVQKLEIPPYLQQLLYFCNVMTITIEVKVTHHYFI